MSLPGCPTKALTTVSTAPRSALQLRPRAGSTQDSQSGGGAHLPGEHSARGQAAAVQEEDQEEQRGVCRREDDDRIRAEAGEWRC